MTIVIYYPSDGIKAFRGDLPKLSMPNYALCWHEKQRPISIDPLETTSLYCGKTKLSFQHLSGPIIFAEENVEINESIITNISDSKKTIVLKDQIYNLLRGICIPHIPIEIDLSSHEAFKIWLDVYASKVANIQIQLVELR